MTAIIGREAVYSGKAVEWDAAMNVPPCRGRTSYAFGPFSVPEVAMPGRYQFQ